MGEYALCLKIGVRIVDELFTKYLKKMGFFHIIILLNVMKVMSYFSVQKKILYTKLRLHRSQRSPILVYRIFSAG